MNHQSYPDNRAPHTKGQLEVPSDETSEGRWLAGATEDLEGRLADAMELGQPIEIINENLAPHFATLQWLEGQILSGNSGLIDVLREYETLASLEDDKVTAQKVRAYQIDQLALFVSNASAERGIRNARGE